MPGRTPNDAFSAFITPLMDALKCVATTKIETSEGRRAVLGRKHNLHLTGRGNDGYLRLGRSGLELRARMYYEIITDNRPDYGPYRITTRGYSYSIRTADGGAVLHYHWHPVGQSHEKRPHMHLGSAQLQPNAILSSKQHLLTGRITFESVIRDLIGMGVEPRYDDWADLLDVCETPHLLHRTWTIDYERETGQKVAE